MRPTDLLALALGGALSLSSQATTTAPARGALVLVGGGPSRPSYIQKFLDLAGGPGATVVLIPTTLEDDRLTSDGVARLRIRMGEILGVHTIVVLHTRDHREADSAAFVEPLRHASGVWVLGGNEEYLMDAYTGTRTEAEIRALLARGGVFGGTSAGAIIQGSATVIGGTPALKALTLDKTHIPFGLLTNSLVIPHWRQRSLQDAVPAALAAKPALLGIGIDEATAAVVQQERLEVVGDGHVGIYDGKEHDGKLYYDLSSGQRFDLKKRVILPGS